MAKRLALGLTPLGARRVIEWDDREPPPKQFYRDGRVFTVVMTMSVEHVTVAGKWKSAHDDFTL